MNSETDTDRWTAVIHLTRAAIKVAATSQHKRLRLRLKNPHYTQAITEALVTFWALVKNHNEAEVIAAYALVQECPRDARNAALLAFAIGDE